MIAQGDRFELLNSCLTPKNQSWAGEAAALILLMSKKTFTQNGKDNAWHLSDAGCAAGFLLLEAESRGLYAHPMAGFDKAKAREIFRIPDDLDIIEVIAVGWPSDAAASGTSSTCSRRRPMRPSTSTSSSSAATSSH